MRADGPIVPALKRAGEYVVRVVDRHDVIALVGLLFLGRGLWMLSAALMYIVIGALLLAGGVSSHFVRPIRETRPIRVRPSKVA